MQSYLFLLSLFSSLVFSAPITTESPKANAEVVRRDLNAILLAIENALPFISGTVAEVCNLITDSENVLATLTGTSTSAYGVSSGQCADVTVVYARGTCDPGNAGFLVGPPFFMALQSQLGSSSVAFQGVSPYAASVTTFLEGGDPQGIQAMASLVQQARSDCPDTKLVMAGYSQGGEIVHKAAALLPAETAQSLSSVVIFGDPQNGQPIPNVSPSNVLTICHEGDDICLGGDLILLPHLTYAEDAMSAAAFVVSQAGL